MFANCDDFKKVGESDVALRTAAAEVTDSVSVVADPEPIVTEIKASAVSVKVGQENARLDPTVRVDTARSRYDRTFTEEELDSLEHNLEGTVSTDTAVAPESEKYDKKLEYRLYPLDETEFKRRAKENAEVVKEITVPTAKLLGISLAKLKLSRVASPAGSSSPEYWEKLYSDTLESSDEAKRANRDFKPSVSSCVSVSREETDVI